MQLHGVGAPGSVPPSGLLRTCVGASCPPSVGSAGTRPVHFPLKTLKTAWLGVGHVQETLKFIL